MARFRPFLGLGALAGGAIFSFFSLFAGNRWVAPVFAAGIGGLAVTASLERLRLPGIVRSLISSAAGVWFLAIFIVPNSLKFGFPNVARLLKVARFAWTNALESTAALRPGPGILLLACAGVWAAALISAAVAIAGRPVFAALPWIGVFALTSTTGAPGNRSVAVLVFIPALFTALFCIRDSPETSLLLKPRWAHPPSDPGGPRALTLGWATLLGSIATVSGVFLGTIVPGYASPAWLSGALPGAASQTVVSPLVQIKPQLLDLGRTKLFEVRASLPAGVAAYWRLMALDEFNGNAWGSSAEYSRVNGPITYAASEAFEGRDLTFRQRYSIDGLGGSWLPAAYQATGIFGIDASVDPLSSSIIARRRVNKGTSYQVTSAVPDATIEDLRGAPSRPAPAPKGLDEYTKLTGVSDAVREIADDWTVGKPTPYDKVVAISDRLRKFRYDESVPAGHAVDQLLFFLTSSKAGYCEQFAASMAVLVRALGIPARVAVGFLPGNFDSGQNAYVVTSRDAHAWPEVYFEGVGWIPFEPTPRSGISPPLYASAGAPAEVREELVTGGQEEDPEAQPPEPTVPPVAATPVPSSTQPRAREASQFWLAAVAAVAVLLVLLAAVAIGKRWRIRRRYRRAATPAEKVRAAFFDFEDRVIDLSRPREIAQTPAEFMEEVRTAFQLDLGAATILIGNFEAAVFSDGDSSDSDALDARKAAALLSGQLWAGSNWAGRVGLLASPRSLLMR